MGQDLLGGGGACDGDGLLAQGGGDGVGEVLRATRVGLGDDPQQFGPRRGCHALGPAELFNDRETLLGGQTGSDNAFQCGMDLRQQPADAVRQAGGLGGEVLIESDQHFEFGEGFFAGVDPAQGVGHGAGGVGDDERVLGVGLRVARIQVGGAAHRKPGKVGDLDAHRPRDCDRQRADRVRLVDDHQYPTVLGQNAEQVLEDLVAARGAPAVLRSDNGPEFISEAMADWAGTCTGLSYIPAGSPWRNGYVESFNSRIRDECLNINSFYSLLHAQVIIGDWKDEYNHHRRHSSLGYLTPAEYARQCTHQMETDDSQNVRTE
ncbi:hypothetical protein SDC9_131681 [bioreactor metagenome]|uniref:Integrase catalytic domain-containing protein n=1 Tax=bioreactor metagenome TaxID=1076179 RepID=A0A645D6B2_9ZZZZ